MYIIDIKIDSNPRSTESSLQWPKYIAGDSYIHEICSNQISDCNEGRSVKEIAFWLQYLPRLANKLISNEQAEKIIAANSTLIYIYFFIY